MKNYAVLLKQVIEAFLFVWSLIWYIETLAKFGSWFSLKCKSFPTWDYKELGHLWWAKLVPLSSMTCHLKQVCVAVAEVQGTLDSYLPFFVVEITDYRLQGTFWGLQICPPAWSRSKHTCAIPDRLSHSSWAVSKPVKKIQGKVDCTAYCCGMSSIALWSCLQATHKISSLFSKTTKTKKFLENFLV